MKDDEKVYGFKTTSAPPMVAEIKQFESEMHDLVKNIKFKKYKPNLIQKKMNDDLKKMKDDEKVYVAADKTSNFYRMSSEHYKELLEQNITKEYKKVNKKVVRKVNMHQN